MIHRDIYVNDRRRIEPIGVVYGSDKVGIELEVKDFTLPSGSTAKAHAHGKNAKETFVNNCSVSGSVITLYPQLGFFVPGYNLFQVDVSASGGHIISFVIDVHCDPDITVGEGAVTPEGVLPYIERAEQAASNAEQSAIRAEEAAEKVHDVSYLTGEVKQIKQDLAQYNAFINHANLLKNPCMIEAYGSWIVNNNGKPQNTITYEATDKICQAMRVVSDGSSIISLVQVFRKQDISSGLYVVSFDVPIGTVSWHRAYFNKSNMQGANAGTLYTGDAVKTSGKYVFEFEVNAEEITTEFCAVQFSFSAAANCLITEPFFGLKSEYNDFYNKDVYRLPLPDIPYSKVVDVEVTPEDTTFVEHRKSANLFNPLGDITEGHYINPTTLEIVDSNKLFYSFVRLNGSGSYTFKVVANTMGVNNSELIPFYDADKNYVKSIRAVGNDSLTTYEHIVSVAVTELDILQGCVYIGYSHRIDHIPTLMIVKEIPYPSEYIKFVDEIVIPNLEKDNVTNPLNGKIVVFDGDSICNANSETTDTTNRGWPYRIGSKNNMTWANVGIGGGVITNGISADKHCLCTYIDTIHQNYPDLDYFIFDGGTNDADNLNSNPDRYGAITPGDFSGNYDDTTFIGAFETLIYKALTYYPHARIGWIIAQKMGASASEYLETGKRYKFFKMGMEVCKKWGIPYINLWDENPLNPMLPVFYDSSKDAQGNKDAGKCYIDGQHLTAKGYDRIAPAIEEWMRTL